MAYTGPSWLTPAGSLGRIKELIPFSFDLDASTGPYTGTFRVISGTLPIGIRITEHGNVAGYPCTQVTGVPLEVPVEELHQFVVRVTDSEGNVADRTFSITVTGENSPVPLRAPYTGGSLGAFSDGSYIELNIQGTDTDPGDVILYRLVQGQLPPGLTLSRAGIISGYVVPESLQEDVYGFDQDFFDTVGFDKGTLFISKNFAFSVQLDDGKIPVIADYEMTVIRSDYLSADTDVFSSDIDSISADIVNKHLPVLLDREQLIATTNDDNHFYYKFDGRDFDGDEIGYDIVSVPGDEYYDDVTALLDLEGGNFGATTFDKSLAQRPVVFKGDALITTDHSQIGSASLATGASGYVTIAQPAILNNFTVEGWFRVTNLAVNPVLMDTRNSGGNSVNKFHLYVDSSGHLTYRVNGVDLVVGYNTLTVDRWYHIALTRHFGTTRLWVGGRLDAGTGYTGYLNDDNNVFTSGIVSIGNNWAGTSPAGYVDSFRVTNGIARYLTNFTVPGTMPATSTGPADINAVIPIGLSLNRNTGWLNGYIATINQGRKVYDFKVRVYKKRYEPSGVNFQVDYAVEVPFNVLDGITQQQLDRLNLDLQSTDFTGRRIIFKRQGGFDTSYYNVTYNETYTTSADDGWRDYANALVPGYAQKIISPSTVANKRGGIWKFYKTGSLYRLEFVQEVFPGTAVQASRDVTVLRNDDLEQNNVNRYTNFYFKDNAPSEPSYVTNYLSNSYESYWNKRLIVENANVAPIVWITDPDLGNIVSGVPSRIQFEAEDAIGSSVVYSLESGELPLGVELDSNGLLKGRVSHQHWRLNDSTSMDKNTTTFDRVYEFTIKASTVFNDPVPREVSTSQAFALTVQDRRTVPSSNLHLDFLLDSNYREEILGKTFSDKLVPDEVVYRLGDWNFGRQVDFRMLVGYGLNPVQDADIIDGIAIYHHRKNYVFNRLKWAQSLDADGNVDYEVIYIDPQDEFTTNAGETFSGNIALTGYSTPYTADIGKINVDTNISDASNSRQLRAYPATLPNMIKRLKQKVSDFDRTFLPSWMLSKQPDGRALNYVTAIPLVYVKPGAGKRVLYKLQQSLLPMLVNAKSDRYYWDDGLTINWDKNNSYFIENPSTTFDKEIADASINVVRTVDYALAVPFYTVNGVNRRVLQLRGDIDGYQGKLHGKTCVFAQQEYPEATDHQTYNGWVSSSRYDGVYDSGYYDTYTVVAANQRPGVWQFREDGDLVYLDFIEEIPYNDRVLYPQLQYQAVRVVTGVRYGGATLALAGPGITGVGTVPSYIDVNSTLINSTVNTQFDADHTRFLGSNTDSYLDKDQGGKYVVFEKTSLLDYGVVDV